MSAVHTINYDVAQLVPHSAAMSLLDDIITYDKQSLQAAVEIHEHSMFADKYGVPAWVGLEYMAQTVAAFAGTLAREQGQQPAVGFLVSTRKYTSSVPYFPLLCRLHINVCLNIQSDDGLSVFDCRLSTEDISAEATLNVYQPDDLDVFLQQEQAESES
ncbi:MAG: hypothetical protein HRU15_20930 [Planctomycetes bacterium]|nr:hypothetical protein [Planctomycetota bacterium]